MGCGDQRESAGLFLWGEFDKKGTDSPNCGIIAVENLLRSWAREYTER